MAYNTRQQDAVRLVIAGADRPLTAAEILREASAQTPGIGLATVYRCLNRLVKTGDARLVTVPGVSPHYESAKAGHHHFFVCHDCEKLFDLHGCASGLSSLLPQGFRMHTHEIVIYGECRECAN